MNSADSELLDRRSILPQTFFQNEVQIVLSKTVLVSDVLAHTGGIYSSLNLANMKIQKLKFVRNSTQDDQRV